MNISKLVKNPRAMKALTGLSWEAFHELLPVFKTALYTIKKENPNRKRAVGGGQKGKLKTPEEKLFFVLFYYKTYPTFDVLGFLFDKSKNRSHLAVREYTKALERALGHSMVLPARRIGSIEEFIAQFPEVKEVLLDGTERRVQRPKDQKRQRRLFSGKKKAHTRKNDILTTTSKRILFVSPTKQGRRHDKRILDKSMLLSCIPQEVGILADSGFQGIQHMHENTLIPKRGTKRAPLSEGDRALNRLISSYRIAVEHAIGGMKRYHILSERFRNKCGLFEDSVVGICAGLWNFSLQYGRC